MKLHHAILTALILPVCAMAQEQPIPFVEQEALEVRPPITSVEQSAARLRALDTITGQRRDLEVEVGSQITYERLTIRVNACRSAGPDALPDSFANLMIQDIRSDSPNFEGWMIASSPALSAMDHPRYDVWVLSCITTSDGVSDGSADQ